jgi:DNA polymerase-3 subunit beta
VKITANAGEIAGALGLAAALAGHARKIASLEAVRLVADDGGLRVSANVLEHALELTAPAAVEAPGETAVSAARLAALAAACPVDEAIAIGAEGTAARIACGRSRFKLPVIPFDQLPAALAFDKESGRVELPREEALELFQRPLFAVSTERTRFYLCGALLHDDGGDLVAVATDGHRLCRTAIAAAAGLSADRTLVVPRPAVEIIVRLLDNKNNERITLRRSQTLLAVEAAGFTFASKLIDSTFPAYERVVPAPSNNVATVDRAAFALALRRVAAVADWSGKAERTVGLAWAAGEPLLRLCLAGLDVADDVVDAEVAGRGRVAAQLGYVAEMLEELGGSRVCVDAESPAGPIRFTDPDNVDCLALLMPCRWPGEQSQAA